MKKKIRPTKPNAGTATWYRKRLNSLIDAMMRSVMWHIGSIYKNNATELTRRLEALRKRWVKKFDEESETLANNFVKRVDRATTSSMKMAFHDVGFNVKLKNTREVQKVLSTIRDTQVNLIKSIPVEYHDRVEGIVRRGVLEGRDIAYVKENLLKHFDITPKRALLISTDQNNKATEAIKRARDKTVGITEGIWIHVPGRKSSRKTHVAMNGKRFKLEGEDAGLYDSAVNRKVLPGQEVSCACTYRPILPDIYQ